MYAILVIAKVLTIIGGLNWGLIGVFDFNLVTALFGDGSLATQIVYIVVGVAALLTIIDLFWTREREPVVVERTRDERPV
ncbi:MAG: DUF378 domain-containing protein [Leucobacter sp.]